VERIPQGGKKKRVWSAFNNSRPVEKTRAQTDLTMQAQYLQDLANITALIKVGFIASFFMLAWISWWIYMFRSKSEGYPFPYRIGPIPGALLIT
jgi:hypothetical protein